MAPPRIFACCRMRAGASSSSSPGSPSMRLRRPDPVAIQTIDFGNGIVDLAVADVATGDVAIFVGDGQGGFSPGPVLDGGHATVCDGGRPFRRRPRRPDRRRQRRSVTGDGQGLTVFQDDGPGQFQFARTIAVGSAPSAIVAGDFTGDGVLDLAVAESNSDDVSVLLNNGKGVFRAPAVLRCRKLPLALVAARLRQRARRPGDRQRQFRTTFRSSWATATARSSRSSASGPARFPSRSWRPTSTATAAPTWPSPTRVRRHLHSSRPRRRHASRTS